MWTSSRSYTLAETAIERNTLGIWGAGHGIHEPRPRNGEPIRINAKRRHDRNVFFITVIVVCCKVAGVPMSGAPGLVREGVPDRRLASTLIHRTLDLVRSCSDPPREVAWQTFA